MSNPFTTGNALYNLAFQATTLVHNQELHSLHSEELEHYNDKTTFNISTLKKVYISSKTYVWLK